MPSFDNLLIVCAIAFAAPFLLGLFPGVRLPSVVLEIVAGIVVGPSLLGWVEVDATVVVVALVGLTFVLFLAGLEIELDKLRGPLLRLTGLAFALSFAIALVVALALKAGGLVETPLLVAIILSATSLGVLVPVLKDAGEISSSFGQLIIAAASIADFGAIILLSIFFSGEGGTGSTLLLLGCLVALCLVVYMVVRGASTSNLLMVPIFLAALVAARGLPALLYRRTLGTRRAAIAGLMQATSLPFIVAATAIGADLGLIDAAESAALVGAGLLSVLLFPLSGLLLLRQSIQPTASAILGRWGTPDSMS